MKFSNIMMAMGGLVLSAGLASCSEDDIKGYVNVGSDIDMPRCEGSLADAPYFSDARAWEVYSEDFPQIRVIELTASGNYMFLPELPSQDYIEDILDAPKQNESAYKLVMKRTDSEAEVTTRAGLSHSNPFAYGKFKKIGSAEYTLEGLGTMTTSQTYIEVQTTNGQTYGFQIEDEIDLLKSTSLTSRLSRTWDVEQIEIGRYRWDSSTDTEKLYDTTVMPKSIMKKYFVDTIIFTQYGSFVQYSDGVLNYGGAWNWLSEKSQLLGVATNFQDKLTSGLSEGSQLVYFYNNYIMLPIDDYRNDFPYEIYDDIFGSNDDINGYERLLMVVKCKANN